MLRRAVLLAVSATLLLAPSAHAVPSGSAVELTRGIATPWEVVRTSDGKTLVTGFSGAATASADPEVRVLDAGDQLLAAPAYTETEPGLTPRKFLGLVESPTVADRFLLYETVSPSGFSTRSRIVGLTYDPATSKLTDPQVVFDGGIRSDLVHDGGRMVFGPDGSEHQNLLFVTTGDVHNGDLPQDLDSLNGKILRMTETGAPAPGNPFDDGDDVREARDYVFSYGHRHPQGLAFVGGELWSSEHGPSGNEPHAPEGMATGHDELNHIVAGGNYGWPLVAGDRRCGDRATVVPVWHDGPARSTDPALAPGDLEWSPLDRVLYMPGLGGERLQMFRVDADGRPAGIGQTFDGTDTRWRSAILDGTDLWLTTHFHAQTSPTASRVLRVGVQSAAGDGVFTALPSVAPQEVDCADAPAGGTPPPPPSSALLVAPAIAPELPRGPVSAPPIPLDVRPSVLRARDDVARRLRALGLRSLLRRGGVAANVRGLTGGRLTLRVTARRQRRTVTVASGGADARPDRATALRAKLTRTGRATLRGRSRTRLVVRVAYVPPVGPRITRTAGVTVTR